MNEATRSFARAWTRAVPYVSVVEALQHLAPILPDQDPEEYIRFLRRDPEAAIRRSQHADESGAGLEAVVERALCATMMKGEVVIAGDDDRLCLIPNALRSLVFGGRFSRFEEELPGSAGWSAAAFHEMGHRAEDAGATALSMMTAVAQGRALLPSEADVVCARVAFASSALSAALGGESRPFDPASQGRRHFRTLRWRLGAPICSGDAPIGVEGLMSDRRLVNPKGAYAALVQSIIDVVGGFSQGVTSVFFPISPDEAEKGGRSYYEYSRLLSYDYAHLSKRFLECRGLRSARGDAPGNARAVLSAIERELREAERHDYLVTCRPAKEASVVRCDNALSALCSTRDFPRTIKAVAEPVFSAMGPGASATRKCFGDLAGWERAQEDAHAYDIDDAYHLTGCRIKVVAFLAAAAICGPDATGFPGMGALHVAETPVLGSSGAAKAAQPVMRLIDVRPSSVEAEAAVHKLEWDARSDTIIVDGRATGSSSVSVGRAAECDLPLTDICLSRRHAAILRDENGWVLVDKGATNGTALFRADGTWASVAEGDRVHIGNGDTVVLGSGWTEGRPVPAGGVWLAVHVPRA